LCESGVAKKGAGSTNARGPAELLRGTWAFQLWHFTERRRWWGRRHVSGGSNGATDGPDRTTSRLQSSTRHWGAEAPLTVRYAAHPSLLRAHRGAKFNAWTRSPWRNPSRRLAWSFRRWLCRRNLQYVQYSGVSASRPRRKSRREATRRIAPRAPSSPQ